jgi:hypothetical protein
MGAVDGTLTIPDAARSRLRRCRALKTTGAPSSRRRRRVLAMIDAERVAERVEPVA